MRNSRIDGDHAAGVAIEALGFLASEIGRIQRFHALTGLSADGIRAGMGDHAFMAGLLDYLLQDESLLHLFCVESGHDPAEIVSVKQFLATDYRNRSGD